MADRELRRLKRRDLLQMLLVQCEETERLQQENTEMKMQLESITESYERLKAKLNIKDERLNEKDARIEELEERIEQMQSSREIELEEAGSIAEAALRINGVFEAAQRAAEQYLMNIRRVVGNVPLSEADPEETTVKKEERTSFSGEISRQSAKAVPDGGAENRDLHETGWRAGIRKKHPRTRQIIPMNVSQVSNGTSGDIHGR